MTITVEHRGLRSVHRIDAKIENDILDLGDLVVIEEARVRLERLPNHTPAYSVRVHLVSPGPDVRVEGADHTLEAAMRKASAELRRRIAAKAARELARVRSNRSTPQAPRRSSGRIMGQRA